MDNNFNIEKNLDGMIEENRDVLLASFGLDGIRRSKLKKEKITEIINSIQQLSPTECLELFYAELKQYYIADSQFNRFTFNEIDTMIAEERAYMMANI